MSPLTLLLGILAGICIATGIIFLFTGLRRPGRDRMHILFALFALAYAGANLTSIMEYKSTTLEAFMRLGDWTAFSTITTLIFLLWFVSAYTNVTPKIFLWGLTITLGLVGAFAIINPNSIHAEISGILTVTFPWDESITRLDATEGTAGIIFFLSELILIGFMIYACTKQWRRGERQEASMLGLGLLFLILALIFDILFIDTEILKFVYLGDYGFIPLLVIMSLQLSNQVIRTDEELASYRQNLEELVNDRTKKLEEIANALQQSERRTRALLDAPPDTAMLVTNDGDILATNEIGAERLGISADEAIGKNIFSLFDPELATVRKHRTTELIQKKQPIQWEDQRVGRYYNNRMYPVVNEQGEIESVAIFAADITESKQAQTALEESEEKYRDLVEKINDVIYAVDLQGVVTYVSPVIEAMIGYPPSELIGKHFSQFVPVDTMNLASAGFQSAVTRRTSSPNEYWIATQSGERRWVRISSQPIEKENQVVGVQGVITDITELKRTQDKLQQNINNLNKLFEIAEIISLETDIRIALQRASEQIVSLFQVLDTQIVYTATKDSNLEILSGYDSLTGPIEPKPIEARLLQFPWVEEIINSGEARIIDDIGTLEFEILNLAKLSERQIQSFMAAPLVVKGKSIGIIFVAGDNNRAEFKPHELALLEAISGYIAAAIENARLAYDSIEAAAVEERGRLARDLHDAVTQTIYSASLITEVLPQVWERNPEEGKRNLTKLRSLVRGALAEMRTMLFELRPTSLEAADFEILLRQLGDALHGRTRIPVQVNCDEISAIPPAIKVALYRIAQEAINNIIKHSDATQAQIELREQSGQILLRVGDNGRGFDPMEPQNGGLGLGIMQERAAGILAEFEVESQPGRGTQVTVIWKEPT